MSFKKYIFHVDTYWCGESNDYGIIKDENSDIDYLCDMWAYENFDQYSGFQGVLEDMFPEVEDDEYTDEQEAEAQEAENEYYSWTLEEFDENGDSEWAWYELLLDESKEN